MEQLKGTGKKARICSHLHSKMRAFFHTQSTPRILLFFIAIFVKLVASLLGGIGFVWKDTPMMVTGTFIWLIWFILLFLIAMPRTDKFLQNQVHWLKPSAIVISTLFIIAGLGLLITLTSFGVGVFPAEDSNKKSNELMASFEGVLSYNDGTALCHQAIENLIDGNNPYAMPNIVTATILYDNSYDQVTPLREGEFADIFPYPSDAQLEQLWQRVSQNPQQIPPELESKLNYPAGCFILPSIFFLLGIDDFRIVLLIFVLPILAYVAWKVPKDKKILFISAVSISLEIWFGIAAGETGSLIFPFLLLAWILIKRQLWLSALFMGIAIATKQVAWFFIPYYLILIFRIMDLKKTLLVVFIVAVIFLAFNLPFIIIDPLLWFTSVMAPVFDDLFPLGVGIITLVTGGVLIIESPLFFTILELLIGITAIIWYYHNCNRYPHVGPLLAVLPLFFAWRSLWPYFFYFDIIILAAILIEDYSIKSPKRLVPVSLFANRTT
ncbi:MAG: hypothetical protein JSV74_07270 [Dehalococcoidia bacterium]|nr:MAG: hypothetical protein JSV74_07270 [Dehalococcoidia bacterium]